MKLQGKTAIITGAAKGIGAAAARRFAAEGARIVLADKDEANGHEVAKAIVKEGGQAAFCLCDVGNEADVQAALDTAARTYGKLDIVVNNAGWQLNKTLLETTAEEFNAVLNTNLTSMFLFTKGAANMFIAQKTGGAIVNVGSIAGRTAYEGGAGYTAAKHGLAVLTETLRLELFDQPVRVTEIAPGMVRTEEFALTRFKGDQDKADRVYAGVAEPLLAEDIADAITWMATRPRHVNIDLLVIKPRAQAAPHKVDRQP